MPYKSHARLLARILCSCGAVAGFSIIIPVVSADHNYDHCEKDAKDDADKIHDCVTRFITGKPLEFPKGDLRLLEPIDPGTTTLPPQNDIQIFYTYFNMIWPWILGIAAGIAVLHGLIGGIQIMMSGSDSGMRENGKSRLLWSIAGMLMIGLAGAILESLNPLFFVQV